jgi:hypothetical protein
MEKLDDGKEGMPEKDASAGKCRREGKVRGRMVQVGGRLPLALLGCRRFFCLEWGSLHLKRAHIDLSVRETRQTPLVGPNVARDAFGVANAHARAAR